MITDYPWGRSYETAILETDRSKLAKHIQVAEQAITTRIQELSGDHRVNEEERAALGDALRGLEILAKEVKQSLPAENVVRGSQGHKFSASGSGYSGQERE